MAFITKQIQKHPFLMAAALATPMFYKARHMSFPSYPSAGADVSFEDSAEDSAAGNKSVMTKDDLIAQLQGTVTKLDSLNQFLQSVDIYNSMDLLSSYIDTLKQIPINRFSNKAAGAY